MSKRNPLDNFTRAERRRAYQNNHALLIREFPAVTAFHKIPHYICESCKFISRSKDDFEIDHVFAVAQGGTRNRVIKNVNVQLREAQKPGASVAQIDQAIEMLFRVGNNAAVLCWECNRKKSDYLFVPDDCGYAYTLHVDDLNPNHIREGPPRPHRR